MKYDECILSKAVWEDEAWSLCWDGQQDSLEEFGPMILASGGFGADFGADSLLATYRPDLLHLPTTNGEHCTGQGLTEIDPWNHEVSG